jgi:hypothetical protein|tara:strand:- start:537 stop:815 length:279 start_codon:yes stop_codon:yes gene_type:complete
MMAVQPANVDAFGNSSGAFSNNSVESDLSSQINGVTQSFVTPLAFNTDSLVVYYNGVRQRTGVEISIVDARNFTTTFTPQSGTVLVAVYKPL